MIFIKKKINIIIVTVILFINLLPIFSIKEVKASSDIKLTNDDYYAIGAVLNSTQDGRSSKTFYTEMVDLGRDIVDTAVDNGIRLSRLIRKRGSELIFNPKNLWEIFIQAWQDGANFHITQVKNQGKTFVINLRDDAYLGGAKGEQDKQRTFRRYFFEDYPAYPFEIPSSGITIEFIGTGIHMLSKYIDDDHYNYTSNSVEIFTDSKKKFDTRWGTDKYLIDNKTIYDFESAGFYMGGDCPYEINKTYDGNSLIARIIGSAYGVQVFRYNNTGLAVDPIHLKKVIISESKELNEIKSLVPYNEIPPLDEIKQNYSSTFVEISDDDDEKDINLNEDGWYAYDVNQIVNNDFNVNNNFVKNDYTEIIIQKDETDVPGQPIEPEEPTDPDPKPDPDPDPAPDPDDPSILKKILVAIKELPQNIYDKFKNLLPESSESGGSFWENFFNLLGNLVSAFTDFITSIPGLILDLLDGLLSLVEKIVALFIPNAEQLDELKQSFNSVTDDFKMKFSPITDVAESIKGVYSSPKSIYDLTYTFNDQTINVVPESFRVAISNFRNVFSGALVVGTFIDIYKRFVGREDVIK